MKIIHTADIHLGSKLGSKFPHEISEQRKKELRTTFSRLIEYANSNDIKVILLVGDIFDSDQPFKKDKDFFYSVVKRNPAIDFLYLKGNHDTQENFSNIELENLKCFSETWTTYFYDSVAISGIELSANNYSSCYSTLSLDAAKTNIVMLHGQYSDTLKPGNILLKQLKNKNIDYLALGHVHKPDISEGKQLDARGTYAYSGCLVGRGFDETGVHGFRLIDTDKKPLTKFIPFEERTINEIDVDISGYSEAYAVSQKVKENVAFDKNNIYRINLIGEVNFDTERLDADVKSFLTQSCYFIDVKDKTKKQIDVTAYEKDVSLRGEFIRTVYNHSDYTEDEKVVIINLGLKALAGKEITL